jgi:hypothetical protein
VGQGQSGNPSGRSKRSSDEQDFRRFVREHSTEIGALWAELPHSAEVGDHLTSEGQRLPSRRRLAVNRLAFPELHPGHRDICDRYGHRAGARSAASIQRQRAADGLDLGAMLGPYMATPRPIHFFQISPRWTRVVRRAGRRADVEDGPESFTLGQIDSNLRMFDSSECERWLRTSVSEITPPRGQRT